jgi:UDP-N-acetylmuramoylalanine--D-glutamate ligase
MRLVPGTKAAVVGLGKSGTAALRYLHGLGLDVRVSEYRSRDELQADELKLLQRCGAEFECGGHSFGFLQDADLVLLSPGVPPDLEVFEQLRARSVPVVGELALAAGKIRVPVIAVTGSNGKTTVTSLITHLLEKAGKKVFMGGNIGTPVLEYLLDPKGVEVVVLELSSFQLQLQGEFRADIALLLNLTEDHLDRHGGMDGYVAAKRSIFANQRKKDTAVIGLDDPLVRAGRDEITAQVLSFGHDPECNARIIGQKIVSAPDSASGGNEVVFDLEGSALGSPVNLLNAAAALAAVRSCGIDPQEIRQGPASFVPPEHRMTPVAEIGRVAYVNDSKATNVGATSAALSGFAKDVVLIAGGRDKDSDFAQLRRVVAEHVVHLVLIGEAAEDMTAALAAVVPISRAGSMREAVEQATDAARPGDTVLLSPACASFDMFENYGHRGRIFTECVLDLKRRTEG